MGTDMRKLIIALLILAFPTWALAGSQQIRQVVTMAKVQSGSALDCTGWTLCEDFEGTGAPASVLTSSGSPDYDATPPATMEGSQALFLAGYTNSADTRVTLSLTDTVGQDNSLFKGQILVSAMGDTSGSDTILSWFDGSTSLCAVSVNDLGATTYAIRVQATGSGLATVTNPLTIGTVYNVWARVNEGTADDTSCSVAFSETDTEPTSGDYYNVSTGGTTEGSIDRVQLWGDYTSATDRWDIYWGFVQAKGNQ